MEKKKMSAGGVILLVFVALLILIVLAGVIFFFTTKNKLEHAQIHTDDIRSHITAEPLPAAERLKFSPDGTMEMKLNKDDIWWFLNMEFEGDIERYFTDVLSDFHMDYRGMGFSSDNGSFSLDIEAYYKSIRLPFTLSGTMTYEAPTIELRFTTFGILNKTIELETINEKFHIDLSGLNISVTPELTFISSIDSVSFGKDELLISGPLNTEMLTHTDYGINRRNLISATIADYCYIGPVLADSLIEPGDPAVCYSSLFPQMAEDPELYLEFLHQFFSFLSDTYVRELKPVLERKNYGFSVRWLGELDPEIYYLTFHDLLDEYSVNFKFFKSVVTRIADAYYAKDLKIADGGFIYKRAPFDPETFFGDEYHYYARPFLLEDMKLFLFTSEEEGVPGNPPALSACIDSLDSIAGEADKNAAYFLGALIPGKDGNTYVLYEGNEDQRIIRVQPLTLPEDLVGLLSIRTDNGVTYFAF